MAEKSKLFAVIGDPIDHSLSPLIHNTLFKKFKMNHNYIAYKIKKNELIYGIDSLKSIHISGFNVTIPHKHDIIQYLDSLDTTSTLSGSVNTVSNINNHLIGYNTDINGFIDPIKKRNILINGTDILLFGSGGVARSIITALSNENVNTITILYRNKTNSQKLAKLSNKFNINTTTISINNIDELKQHYDFIINATPLGLNNEIVPIPTKLIKQNIVVYDLVYTPLNTDLLKRAKNKHARVIYGYEMLIGQAIGAFKIWHNKTPSYKIMEQVILRGF